MLRMTVLLCLLILLQPIALAEDKTPPSAPEPSRDAPATAQPALVVPSPEALLAMIRTTLLALDHANKTNNYTVLRDLGGPQLQGLTAARLGELFAPLRDPRIDLSSVAIVTPQVTQPPAISKDGLLVLVGNFPTQPWRIEFDVVYQPVNGRWRLFGVNVKLGPQAVAKLDESKDGAKDETSGKASPAVKKAPDKTAKKAAGQEAGQKK